MAAVPAVVAVQSYVLMVGVCIFLATRVDHFGGVEALLWRACVGRHREMAKYCCV